MIYDIYSLIYIYIYTYDFCLCINVSHRTCKPQNVEYIQSSFTGTAPLRFGIPALSFNLSQVEALVQQKVDVSNWKLPEAAVLGSTLVAWTPGPGYRTWPTCIVPKYQPPKLDGLRTMIP